MELVTQLGNRLGRRARASVTLVECARTHLWKPLLHAVAAGSIDPGEYEVNYLAQAHWHAFRYYFGEMIGSIARNARYSSARHSTRKAARSPRRTRSATTP